MDYVEIKSISEQVMSVRLDIRELSTKMDGIKDLAEKVDVVDDTAKEALQSTKSAHLRIDKIDKMIFWLGTTVVGTVVTGIITLLWKG